MEDMNQMFNDSTESSTYVEGSDNSEQKKEFIKVEPGDYKSHITEYSSRIVEWTKGEDSFKARVHNYVIKIAEGDSHEKGRTFRSSGCFQFLEPQKGDKFVSNSSGNKAYLRFCEDLGIECSEVEREIDGTKVKVKQLPNVSEKDVLGKPVIAVLNYGKEYTNKNGYKTKPLQCKFIKKWSDGEIVEIKTAEENLDEIPF